MATKSGRPVYTVREKDCEELASWSGRGEYDFPRTMIVLRPRSGGLAGKIIISDNGFAWNGSTGCYRESATLLDRITPEQVAEMSALIKAGRLSEAQEIAYAGICSNTPIIRVV
jgi:hypothetical protein